MPFNPSVSTASSMDLLTPLCVENFDKFVKLIQKRSVGKMHMEIINTLSDPETKNLGVLAGRGLLKTSLITEAHSIWECWRETYLKRFTKRDPLVITIQCHNLRLATQCIRRIQTEVEEIPALREVLLPPNINDTTWNAKECEFKNNTRIIALPFGGSSRGEHPFINICDDIYQSEEGTIVSSEIENTSKTFWSSVFPTVIKGKHLVVGTPASFNDLYHEIKERAEEKGGWKFLCYPSVIEDAHGNWIASQFPEKYPLSFWEQRRKDMPAWSWLKEYMCKPVGDATAIFPVEHIQGSISLPWADLTEQEAKYRSLYLGGDIAFGQDRGADYSAFYFIEKVPGRPLNVFRREVFRGVPEPEQVRRIREWHQLYKFHKLVIEQKGISWSMVNKMKEDDVLRGYVYPFDTNSSNKEKLVSSLSMLLKDKQLRIQDWKPLVSQLSSFGIRIRNGRQTYEALTGHDDEVMALAMACEAAGGWVTEKKAPVTAVWI